VRILIALGGNAITGADGSLAPAEQQAAVAAAMDRVSELIADGVDVLLTHGNGPQVGEALRKNELLAQVMAPMPLDWCGAQTQATIGFTITNALEAALAERGLDRQVVSLITRTLVDPADPGFAEPSKPIGEYLPEVQAKALMALGQTWQDRGPRGWRRIVASPEPVRIVEAPAARALLAAGFIVVAAGGGGVPVVPDGRGFRGVEAVIDKDLTAALLAAELGADVLVIATDVPHAVLSFGTPAERPLSDVPAAQLRRYAADGHFASGSMGPKVRAALRFVESGGARAVITDLASIPAAARGKAGTVVEP
jgi:carbamate kinase